MQMRAKTYKSESEVRMRETESDNLPANLSLTDHCPPQYVHLDSFCFPHAEITQNNILTTEMGF